MPSVITIVMMNAGVGGAQRAMVNLANQLTKDGILVRILVSEKKGSYLSLLENSIEVKQLGRNFFRMTFEIHRDMANNPRGAYLATQTKPSLACALAKMLSRYKCRLIIREPNRLTTNSDLLFFKLAMSATPFLYRQADALIAVNCAVADDLESIGIAKKNIFTIGNCVNSAAIEQQLKTSIDDPWFALGAPPVILGVGRLTDQKGFDILLRAFAKLCKHREARLLILGEGHLREYLEKLCEELGISERCRLPGFTENPYPYMAKAAVFVLSSRWEGSPNALLEALACGCPVVSTDCPTGPREILSKPELGWLTPIDDIDEIALKMAECIAKPQDRTARRKHVKDVFDVEVWSRHYYKVICGANHNS